eukprot:g5918.t1
MVLLCAPESLLSKTRSFFFVILSLIFAISPSVLYCPVDALPQSNAPGRGGALGTPPGATVRGAPEGWKSDDDYVRTRHYPDENLTPSTVEGYNMVRKIRRAVRRAVSKHPDTFRHEEPHIRDWKQKVDDLEDLESRADMIAHHMTDPFPSLVAGDSASERDDVGTMPQKDREAKEQKEDEAFFSNLKPAKAASPAAKFAGGAIERRSAEEATRRLKLEEEVKSAAAKAIARAHTPPSKGDSK